MYYSTITFASVICSNKESSHIAEQLILWATFSSQTVRVLLEPCGKVGRQVYRRSLPLSCVKTEITSEI